MVHTTQRANRPSAKERRKEKAMTNVKDTANRIALFNGVDEWYNVGFDYGPEYTVVFEPTQSPVKAGTFVHVIREFVGPYCTGYELQEAPGLLFNSVWCDMLDEGKPVYTGRSLNLPVVGERYSLTLADGEAYTSKILRVDIIGKNVLRVETQNSIYITRIVGISPT